VNTDDRTLLEYLAPVTERNRRGSGQVRVLAWNHLLGYLEELLSELPPDRDPHLVRFPDSMRRQVPAGLARYGYTVHRSQRDGAAAERYLAAYQQWLGADAQP
jgi:hypothetical protein